MTPARTALLGLGVAAAVLLQTTVVARLPLPGRPPDLVLVLVVAVGLAAGPLAGAATGFAAGLVADLVSDGALGRLALAYLVAGAVAGRWADDPRPSVLVPLRAVAAGATAALLVYALEGVLLGDPRARPAAAGPDLLSSVLYDLALTPLVAVVGRAYRAGTRPGPPGGVRPGDADRSRPPRPQERRP